MASKHIYYGIQNYRTGRELANKKREVRLEGKGLSREGNREIAMTEIRNMHE